jgi:hypothetical protein
MVTYRVTLIPEERADLEELISAGRSASRKLTHARILLLADSVCGDGHTDDEFVTALGTSLTTIARVPTRVVVEGLEAAVDHTPQPASPDKIKIKGSVEQKLVQLARTDPPRGRRHWTLQLLADEMVVSGLVDSISTETALQALKKTTSSRGLFDHHGAFLPELTRFKAISSTATAKTSLRIQRGRRGYVRRSQGFWSSGASTISRSISASRNGTARTCRKRRSTYSTQGTLRLMPRQMRLQRSYVIS